MRVMVVGPVPPIQGGIAQHTQNLVDALRRGGHDVSVVSWRSQYPKLLYKGASYVVPKESGVAWDLVWWNPLTWLKVGRRAAGYDRVVFQWVHPFQSVALWVMATAAGRERVVFHVHNVTPHESFPFAARLAARVLSRSRLLVVHASALHDELVSLGIDRPTIVVAHPSNIVVSPTPPPSGEPRLLFLGYLREYKGADIGVAALALLRERGLNATLTIAGSPWGDTDWPGVCDAAGVADAVNLELTYVSDDRMAELLASHHILIAPYRSATQSGVIPLAFAAGRPVVVTDVGGLAEFVKDGVNGVVCEPESAEQFAAAVERAWAAYPLLQQNAHLAAANWDDVSTEYLA